MDKFIKILNKTILLLIISSSLYAQKKDTNLQAKLDTLLKKWENPFEHTKTSIVSSKILKSKKLINLYFSKSLSNSPVREESVNKLHKSLNKILKADFPKYKIEIYSHKKKYDDLVPNFYRNNSDLDESRIFFNNKKKVFINKIDAGKPSNGLYNNHIALWHSHGRYYEAQLDRWEWQRSRNFTTIEDLLPMSFVLPYLAPMLENAGATVYMPRERDIQTNEIIVDNDISSEKSDFVLTNDVRKQKTDVGFIKKDTLFNNDNPFKLGTSLNIVAKKNSHVATYIPYVPKTGEYAVYVSYKQHKRDAIAKYSVYHSGGITSFELNQSMGGGTWIYIGTFKFEKGKNPDVSKIEVFAVTSKISLDAIRIGGGMGNVARRNKPYSVKVGTPMQNIEKWKISQKARYLEGARYWLQYAGMPEYVYSLNDGENDYKDDYQSRGVWANYLNGTLRSQKKKKHGLNIPIDLSLAFHTDAGIRDKSFIGTLAIYNTLYDGKTFPNKQSKLASRDFADIAQTQIVNDIRRLYDKNWTRRAMWDSEYNEAWKPNVPALLLELLSHQNLNDMILGLEPRFRFDVSRAIYKAILKFQSFQENREYVVQPLPINHLAIKQVGAKEFELSWKPVLDSLETSAKPTKYKVYKRLENKGFDNGIIVENTKYRFAVNDLDKIFSFKVTAINEGGESMPSEVLSVGLSTNNKDIVLVVNAFDRVCAPAIIKKGDYAGVEWWNDEGVAHNYNAAFTGNQYDFEMKKSWQDDDNPGWGASYGNMEGKPIPGNTFDFVYTHGKAILNAGHSFVSVSDEAFTTTYNANGFKIVDVILGEEKSTLSYIDSSRCDFVIYTNAFMNKINTLVHKKTNIFLSGAYIGTDLENNKEAIDFAERTLHISPMTNHAVKMGHLYTSDYASRYFKGSYEFNTQYLPSIYKVEAPDAIEPCGQDAITAFRYSENNTSAGVLYNKDYKIVALGFPFETIVKEKERFRLMNDILQFFSL